MWRLSLVITDRRSSGSSAAFVLLSAVVMMASTHFRVSSFGLFLQLGTTGANFWNLCRCAASSSILSLLFLCSLSSAAHCHQTQSPVAKQYLVQFGLKDASGESSLRAVHEINASVHKTQAFWWRKLQNSARFLWLQSTHIIFPVGAEAQSTHGVGPYARNIFQSEQNMLRIRTVDIEEQGMNVRLVTIFLGNCSQPENTQVCIVCKSYWSLREVRGNFHRTGFYRCWCYEMMSCASWSNDQMIIVCQPKVFVQLLPLLGRLTWTHLTNSRTAPSPSVGKLQVVSVTRWLASIMLCFMCLERKLRWRCSQQVIICYCQTASLSFSLFYFISYALCIKKGPIVIL